jgi:hypothetical protein
VPRWGSQWDSSQIRLAVIMTVVVVVSVALLLLSLASR